MDLSNISEQSCVLVIWSDSNFAKGWHFSEEETYELPTIFTIGWVTKKTKDLIEVTSTKGHDGAKLNPLSIPLGCVSRIENLEETWKSTTQKPQPSDAALGNIMKPMCETEVA